MQSDAKTKAILFFYKGENILPREKKIKGQSFSIWNDHEKLV